VPSRRLQEFLDSKNVNYNCIRHELAFTGIEIAKAAHVPTKQLAKTIIIIVEGQPAMMVLPSAYQIDMRSLSQAFKPSAVTLADENQFSKWFPDCEVGAMPPFGNLYDMDVFVAESLTENEEIAFNAGSHSEVIQMCYRDYEALVKPKLVVLN
jgi:Ala-tRNA(Pro) deacylase